MDRSDSKLDGSSQIDWTMADRLAEDFELQLKAAESRQEQFNRKSRRHREYWEAFDQWKMSWQTAINARNGIEVYDASGKYKPEISLAKSLDRMVHAIKDYGLENSLHIALSKFLPTDYSAESASYGTAVGIHLLLQMLATVNGGKAATAVVNELWMRERLPDLCNSYFAMNLLPIAERWPVECDVCKHLLDTSSLDQTICLRCAEKRVADCLDEAAPKAKVQSAFDAADLAVKFIYSGIVADGWSCFSKTSPSVDTRIAFARSCIEQANDCERAISYLRSIKVAPDSNVIELEDGEAARSWSELAINGLLFGLALLQRQRDFVSLPINWERSQTGVIWTRNLYLSIQESISKTYRQSKFASELRREIELALADGANAESSALTDDAGLPTADPNDEQLPLVTEDIAKDYLPFCDVKAKHLPADLVVTDKKLRRFLDQATDIRLGNPRGKSGKANRQRLLVHVGDFVRNVPELQQWLKAHDEMPPCDMAERIKAVQVARGSPGSGRSTSKQLPS